MSTKTNRTTELLWDFLKQYKKMKQRQDKSELKVKVKDLPSHLLKGLQNQKRINNIFLSYLGDKQSIKYYKCKLCNGMVNSLDWGNIKCKRCPHYMHYKCYINHITPIQFDSLMNIASQKTLVCPKCADNDKITVVKHGPTDESKNE